MHVKVCCLIAEFENAFVVNKVSLKMIYYIVINLTFN